MQVNRAVEKLRKYFIKRGVTLSASAITGAVAANSVQAAPAALAAAITSVALSGTSIATTAIFAATKAIAMTTLQKTVVTATIAVLAATGIYESRQIANARAAVQTLQRQQAPLAEQVQQLQRERDATARQLASLREENERLNRNTGELLKLRGQLSVLRNTAPDPNPAETDSILTAAKSLVERVNILKKWIAQRPEEQIPEFQYLYDYDWIDAVKSSNMLGEHAPKNAMSGLRDAAKRQFAHEMGLALRQFVDAHNGDLPADLAELNAYFARPMNDAILKSYKLLHTGKLADLPKDAWLVSEIAPFFDDNDRASLLIRIGDSRKDWK